MYAGITREAPPRVSSSDLLADLPRSLVALQEIFAEFNEMHRLLGTVNAVRAGAFP